MGDFKPEHEGWLYKDVERAQERSAELAEMSDAQRVGLLRAELAAMEADYEVQQENYDAALEELDAARARIAELEHDLLHGHESGPIRSMRARAEQAEKRVGELEAEREAQQKWHMQMTAEFRETSKRDNARAEQIELANKEFGDQLAHAHIQLAEAKAEIAELKEDEKERFRLIQDADVWMKACWKAQGDTKRAEAQLADCTKRWAIAETTLEAVNTQLAEAHTELALWRKHSPHAELAKAKAERDAMRELLDWIYGFLAYVDSYHSRMIRDKIRAALAPPPAGKDNT